MTKRGENQARVAPQVEGGVPTDSGSLGFYRDLFGPQSARSSGPPPREVEGAAGEGTAGPQLEGATRDADPRQPELE